MRRIQRKRTKGWRMPKGAVYVGRPSPWGNPFPWHGEKAPWMALALGERADVPGRRAAAVKLHRWWIEDGAEATFPAATKPQPDESALEYTDGQVRQMSDIVSGVGLAMWLQEPLHLPPRPNLSPLRGHDLVCWCPLDQPCHADVLLELTNR